MISEHTATAPTVTTPHVPTTPGTPMPTAHTTSAATTPTSNQQNAAIIIIYLFMFSITKALFVENLYIYIKK